MTAAVQNKESVIEYLRVLSDTFDEFASWIRSLEQLQQRCDGRLEAFKGINFAEKGIVERLPSMFTPEQLAMLLRITILLGEFNPKSNPVLDDMAREFNRYKKIIYDVQADLHKLVEKNDA